MPSLIENFLKSSIEIHNYFDPVSDDRSKKIKNNLKIIFITGDIMKVSTLLRLQIDYIYRERYNIN